jgi:membrane protein implicated in regulation of membrane protease activity
METFFEGMTSLEQTYWIIALIGSAAFLVIFILTFIGGGDTDMEADASDFEADDGGVGFQFFTFKNVVAFFTIFGWSGVTCLDNGLSTTLTLIISTIAGIIMMVLTSLLFYWMYKLAESGTLKIQKAVGVIGEVYLPIGAERSKMGKVQIKVQGSLRELEAITDEPVELKTGSMVKVTEIVSAEILLVEKLSK